MARVVEVKLPLQAGCQHIIIVVQHDDGRNETHTYHMSDFQSPTPIQDNDSLYTQLRTIFRSYQNLQRTNLPAVFRNLEVDI